MRDRLPIVPPAVVPYGAAEMKVYEPSVITLLTSLLVLPESPPLRRPDSTGTSIIGVDFRPPWIPRDLPTGAGHPGKSYSTFAIPIPVPFENVDTSVAFPSVGEFYEVPCDSGVPGGEIEILNPAPDEVEPGPFEPRQVEPTVALRVDPLHPLVAIRAGLEGSVFVRLWVDTRRTVRRAEVIK